jgi:hypothetical protein
MMLGEVFGSKLNCEKEGSLRRIPTNVSSHLGVVGVVTNSRVVRSYAMFKVWIVVVCFELYHFPEHVVAEFHDLLANVA